MNIKDIVKDLGIDIYRENMQSHELYCFCPLHDDKHDDGTGTPSFNINYITGKWQCWSCHEKGQTIQELAKQINGKVYLIDQGKWLEKFKNKLYPVVSPIREPLIPKLPLAIGNEGETFLTKRGIIDSTIKKWNLLYWESVNGVVIPAEQIGYIIRYLHAKTTRDKYKYVCGTKITNCLFGEKAVNYDKYKFTFLVEGSLDVIAMHQKGFSNTLGLLHSDLSDTQLYLLRNYQYPVYLLLDPDDAGRNASEKIKNKIKGEFRVKVCSLPEGKDPDECTVDEINESIRRAI
jgi:DNA primase